MTPSKILVALSHPAEAADLISLACIVAAPQKKAEIYVLHVIVIPRSLPLEAEMKEETEKGEAMLAAAEEIAEDQFGLKVETDLLQAREVGPAILEEAQEKGVDLILLGHDRPRRFGPRVLGVSTVEYVSRYAPCHVLISVAPVVSGSSRGTLP